MWNDLALYENVFFKSCWTLRLISGKLVRCWIQSKKEQHGDKGEKHKHQSLAGGSAEVLIYCTNTFVTILILRVWTSEVKHLWNFCWLNHWWTPQGTSDISFSSHTRLIHSMDESIVVPLKHDNSCFMLTPAYKNSLNGLSPMPSMLYSCTCVWISFTTATFRREFILHNHSLSKIILCYFSAGWWCPPLTNIQPHDCSWTETHVNCQTWGTALSRRDSSPCD